MNLSPMRFKNFIWPHNPRVYSITYERKMAANKIPFGRYVLQSLGQTRRVFRGEGEFVGEGAYETFKKLATVFYEETPGTLIHPVWTAATAWFVGLELEQEPRSDYVRYSFEFWEVVGGIAAAPTVRTEKSGDEPELHPEQNTSASGAANNGAANNGAADSGAAGSGKDGAVGKPVKPVSSGSSGDGFTEVAFGPAAGEKSEQLWHTVVKGESLWVIARRYDTTVDGLLTLNPAIRNPNLILIGQKVRVR